MSRKKTQPKKVVTPDPIFNSTIIPKLINSIMYDGKKGVAEKIVDEAIEKIKSKTKEEPINVFNEAINNIKPTVEVRSRRVGGATYQVPVEVKSKRAQALAPSNPLLQLHHELHQFYDFYRYSIKFFQW